MLQRISILPFVAMALLAAGQGALAETASEPLGRLFHTPQQRAVLDQKRLGNHGPTEESGPLTINGMVRRSSGRQTIWLNGQPNDDRFIPTLPSDSKVGHTIQPTTGEKEDLLDRGSIVINHARPSDSKSK